MAGNPNAALLIINQQTYWPTEGTEPADVSKDWKPRQRPPSAWFDWFFRATYKDIEALALFMQEYGMTRGFGPGLFEFPGTTGAEIGFVGTNNLPVGYMAAGVERQLHIADRVVQPTGEDTLVKVVWSSPNTLASKDARLTVGYRETGAGDSRDGALTEITQVVGDSTTEMRRGSRSADSRKERRSISS